MSLSEDLKASTSNPDRLLEILAKQIDDLTAQVNGLISAPPPAGDNLGDHTATTPLLMAGFDISGVGDILANGGTPFGIKTPGVATGASSSAELASGDATASADSGDVTVSVGSVDSGTRGIIHNQSIETFLGDDKDLFISEGRYTEWWGDPVPGFFGDSAILSGGQDVLFFATSDSLAAGTASSAVVFKSGDQYTPGATTGTGSADFATGDIDTGVGNTGGINMSTGFSGGTGSSGNSAITTGSTRGGNSGNVNISTGGVSSAGAGGTGDINFQIGGVGIGGGFKGQLKTTGHTVFVDRPTLLPAGTTQTIDWRSQYNNVSLDLNSATGDVTLTLDGASSGNRARYSIKVIQGSVTRNLIWPASVKWLGGTAPTISAANDSIDLIELTYVDGDYLGSYQQAFS